MKPMKLEKLYELLLATAGMHVTKDGFVSIKIGEESKPVMVKSKRLVLPVKEHLANPDWSNRVVFHPLSENLMRGESDVLEVFRSAINVRLNNAIGILLYQLASISASTAQHSKLNPDQSEFLSCAKGIDNKTLEVLEKLMQAMPAQTQTQKSFVHLFLKRNGTHNGKAHRRLCTATFPLYDELAKGNNEVYGVKMRKLDREALVRLFNYLFPNIETKAAYSNGSDSDLAPFMDALMKSVMLIASRINDTVELFKDQLDSPEELIFESGWVPTFDNLNIMAPAVMGVPMQAGNEGATGKETVAQAPAPVPVTTAPIAPQPVHQPIPQPAPLPYTGYQAPVAAQPARTERGVDFAAWRRTQPGGNVQQPAWNQPNQYPQQQPVYYNQQPQQPQYGYQQPGSQFSNTGRI